MKPQPDRPLPAWPVRKCGGTGQPTHPHQWTAAIIYGRTTAALFSWPILCCSATAFLQRKISSTTAPSGSGGKCASPTQRQCPAAAFSRRRGAAPEDAVMDEPEHGSYSAGFLAQTIDNKMAQLRGTTNSFFLGSVRRTISSLGIFAYWWWRCCGWHECMG